MQQRKERVLIETQRHRITGTLTLPAEGYRSRVSDLLNAGERDFISLTDTDVETPDGGPAEHHRFMAVSRHHIAFLVVLDDDRAGASV